MQRDRKPSRANKHSANRKPEESTSVDQNIPTQTSNAMSMRFVSIGPAIREVMAVGCPPPRRQAKARSSPEQSKIALTGPRAA
jgi:hypothetical protein